MKKGIILLCGVVIFFSISMIGCKTTEETVREFENVAMVRVIEGDRESLEFSVELFGSVNTLNPGEGDRFVVVMGQDSTARVQVLQYDEENHYMELKFTEKGMSTNFDDYVIGGAILEVRPDPNVVQQTGGAGAIDG